jgi:hypothetical protein
MSNPDARMCVLLPCGGDLRWAVPQSCLAEILTIASDDPGPPQSVVWRELEVPVVDIGADSGTPWRNPRSGTGLVVIVLGVNDEGSDYWGLALRGDGLSVRDVQEADCKDLPESLVEHSLAAFSLDGIVYQIPDLPAMQRLSVADDTAISA